ncbi:hypothetical protein GW915_13530 [bacterium]|nr:hypothetical protein [bacterium]
MSGQLTLGEKLNRISGVVDTPAHAGKPGNQMDKDAFMKMLMEQIKYQDPFNPVKNEQFAAHLTAMSQLEQQVTTNKNLEKLVGQNSNSQMAALQVVGKSIVANKATVYYDQEKASDLVFDMPQPASEVSVVVRDGKGQAIRTMELGAQGQGKVETKWDGYTDDQMIVPVGRYSYAVVAKDLSGKEIDVKTKIEGKVTGVTTFNGETFLLVGTERVGLNDIESINLPDDPKEQAPVMGAPDAKKVASAKPTSGTESEGNSTEQSEAAKRLDALLPLLYR